MIGSDNIKESEARWQECPAGTLTTMASQARRRKSRHELLMVGSLLSSACLLVAAGYSVWLAGSSMNQSSSPSRMNCAQVIQLADSYLNQQLGESDRQLIARHLDHCPSCRKKYQEREAILDQRRLNVGLPDSKEVVRMDSKGRSGPEPLFSTRRIVVEPALSLDTQMSLASALPQQFQ
jgi:hypothetical protein